MEDNYKLLLAKRYLQNSLTTDELEVFFHLVQTGEMDSYLTEALEEHRELIKAEQPKTVPMIKRNRLRKMWWAAAAAIIVIMCSTAIYFLYTNSSSKTIDPVISASDGRYKNDVQPGTTKAVLILADGSAIELDSAGSGTIAGDGGSVVQYRDGQLVYDGSTMAGNAVVYNKVNTYNGGQYAITLSDGTKAWLNAASSLRFPTVFTGSERKVEITGEVYFEVAKNETAPFMVSMNEHEFVEVTGTRFNVNAYPEAATKSITLLEGAVSVHAGTKKVQLQPGQQARLHDQAQIALVNDADLEAVMAWKNGIFLLNSDIKDIMLQVQRWYNVEVVYEGAMPTQRLRGKIGRNEPLSRLLQILELTGLVRFSIEGNVVTVMR